MTVVPKISKLKISGAALLLSTLFFPGCETMENPDDLQVDYTIVIKDADTKRPLKGAKGRFTYSDRKQESFKSDADGIIEFSTYSLNTDMSFTLDDYVRIDTVDVVPSDSNAIVNFRNLSFFMYSDTATIPDIPDAEVPPFDSALVRLLVQNYLDSVSRADSLARADTANGDTAPE